MTARRTNQLAVLIGLVSLAWPTMGSAQCITPPQFINITSSTAGDLQFVMGVDSFQCAVGSPVSFYLSVYNSASTTVVIPNPGQVSAIHQWHVLPDTCITIYEPDGCRSDTPFIYPEGVFYFGLPLSLAPGQCKVYTTMWSGQHWGNPNLPVLPGTYHVLGGFLVGSDAVTSQGAPLPAMVVPLQIVPVSGVPVEGVSWSRVKARFLR